MKALVSGTVLCAALALGACTNTNLSRTEQGALTGGAIGAGAGAVAGAVTGASVGTAAAVGGV
ncbi:MAG: OmpA family protein, partial [Alphaproteobacteria bacterium]|nr:OmpA family protein [Alphaproteobacteria bacterium]